MYTLVYLASMLGAFAFLLGVAPSSGG